MKNLLLPLLLTGCLMATLPAAWAQTPMAPINAGGAVVIDLPDSSAENVRLQIQRGRFASQSVGKIDLEAQGIDFRQGTLKKLVAEIQEGNFDSLVVDQLKLSTDPFSFDTMELLNHRRFVLDHAVNAAASLKLSEDSLNRFFSSPKTIERLEKAVAKKTGGMSIIRFSNPSLNFLGKNRIKLTLNTAIGDGVGTPMELMGNLGVSQGKLAFSNLKVSSNGVSLPVDVSGVLQNKLNELFDLQKLGKNSFVLQARQLVMNSKTLEIQGTAALTRLEFGN